MTGPAAMTDSPWDAVIVGGGPAGLAAALELGSAGARTLLLDEHGELGGQYFRRRSTAVRVRHGDHRPAGTRLIAAVREAGVEVWTGAVVWGWEDDELHVVDGAGSFRRVRGRRLLLATGAVERSIPFPGWTLPGVVTPGLALHLATMDLTPVGRSVLVAGSGPFLLPVACAILKAGGRVAALLELRRPYRVTRAAVAMAGFPRRLLELAGYMAVLRRHGVRVRQGWRVLAAEGAERVSRVRIGRVGSDRVESLDVDAVCVGYGFRPGSELARVIGCECRVDPATGDVFPVVDGDGRTSRPEVFAAGEVAAIGGVHAAVAGGRVAALAMLRDLGRVARDSGWARRRAARAARFGALTAAAFPPAMELCADLPDHTVVCRCEAVTAGRIRDAAGRGWNDLDAVKGASRAGMGPCQGRECGHVVAALVAAEGGGQAFPARMPVRPIPLGGEVEA